MDDKVLSAATSAAQARVDPVPAQHFPTAGRGQWVPSPHSRTFHTSHTHTPV